MRTILVFLDPACGPTCCWFLAFPATRSLPLAAIFFTRSSAEPAEPEQLSRLRGFASIGLCYTVPCATLSKGLTVEQCKTFF